jgi:hypothetical protein
MAGRVAGTICPRSQVAGAQRRSYAALFANSMGSVTERSSFSGLLTRVEIGHVRIKPAGNGRNWRRSPLISRRAAARSPRASAFLAAFVLGQP